jgi:sulfite reductase (NADPH) flavoprotein alpha-component
MGQLDCGQCGYLCHSYAQSLADGTEQDVGLCVPGGKSTKDTVKKLLAAAPTTNAAASSVAAAGSISSAGSAAVPKHGGQSPTYGRKNPLRARLKESRRLTAEGSEKDVRFVSIDIAGSGLTYQAGDSLGVFPANSDRHVQQALNLILASGAERLPDGNSLRSALREEFDLRRTTDEFWQLCRQAAPRRAADIDAWADAEDGPDVVETLYRLGGLCVPAVEFAAALGALQPRLYSISSSPLAHPDEVQLTVGVVKYELDSGPRDGVASTLLAERLQPGDPVRVFVQSSPHFRLPADDVPIVMVGPGTGVAPFRAFLQERGRRNSVGGNWLFFGAARQESDFLYEQEFAAYLQSGVLARLDTAFSRDQDRKVYVQQRMLEHGAELWRWLERGAHVYVCGDARRMAKDVDATLKTIIAEHGGMNPAAAAERVAEWGKSGRYARDVY